MPDPIRVTVVTPAEQVLDTEATYADVPGHDGQLGVEHLRAALLTKLGTGVLTLTLADGGKQRRYFVDGGFAQVKDDVLTILTDEAIPASELDRAEVDAGLKSAQSLKGDTPEAQAHKDRELTRARAMAAAAR